jgi:hypothetical protein
MSTNVTKISEGFVRKVDGIHYSIAKIIFKPRAVRVNQSLPFRVRLTNVGIASYGPSSPAPIGIAVIGFNNYIL